MKRSRGYILVITISIIAVLMIFALLYVDFYRSENSLNQKAESSLILKAAADAGIQDAIHHLKNDQGWKTGFSEILLPHTGASYSMTFDPTDTVLPYSVNNIHGTTPVKCKNGRVVPPANVYLCSVGKYNGLTRAEEALLCWHSVFNEGIGAKEKINIIGNSIVDSFDSALGDYNQSHSSSGGDIHTNAGGNGAVTLDGGASVYGNVTVGPGGSYGSAVTNGGSSFTGTLVVSSTLLPMPFLSPPSGQNDGDLVLKGSTRTLSQGVYVFSTMDLSGGASLQVSGPVTIFVLGNISVTGNSSINTTTRNSMNLTIIGGPKTTSVNISGHGSKSQAVYCSIYAPAADVKISGNDQAALYGSVIANSVSVSGGTSIHYDQALKNSSVKILSIQSRWR